MSTAERSRYDRVIGDLATATDPSDRQLHESELAELLEDLSDTHAYKVRTQLYSLTKFPRRVGEDDVMEIKIVRRALPQPVTQIENISLTPLNVKGRRNDNGEEQAGVYMDRVRRGVFLRETRWGDARMVEKKKLPQEVEKTILGDSKDFNAAVVATGKYREEQTKTGKYGEALAQLRLMRDSGQKLVSDHNVVSQVDMDMFIFTVATNILYDLFSNRDNFQDLTRQTMKTLNFMKPSEILDFIEKLGLTTSGQHRIIGDTPLPGERQRRDERIEEITYRVLSEYAQTLIVSSAEALGLVRAEGDDSISRDRERAIDFILPKIRGKSSVDKFVALGQRSPIGILRKKIGI